VKNDTNFEVRLLAIQNITDQPLLKNLAKQVTDSKLKDEIFVRVIGANGKPAMPWAAKKDIKNTMIKANEKRSVKYDFKISKGDKVDVVLGWYLVNPKAVKKLGLEKEEVATKFNIFQKKSFNF